MEAEEWGRRALAADRGGLMQRPRLLDLLSRRWYSIGDCKAERHRGTEAAVTKLYTHLNYIKTE